MKFGVFFLLMMKLTMLTTETTTAISLGAQEPSENCKERGIIIPICKHYSKKVYAEVIEKRDTETRQQESGKGFEVDSSSLMYLRSQQSPLQSLDLETFERAQTKQMNTQLNITTSEAEIERFIFRQIRDTDVGTPSLITARSRQERRSRVRSHAHHRLRNDISLWIDEHQVRMFSGYSMEIYVIVSGRVMPYILEPEFEDQLPIIPSEVQHVNFTWRSGGKRYFYNFDLLASYNKTILQKPFLSIRKKGKVPRKPKVFSVRIPCAGNASGMASFGIGLRIEDELGVPLPGTPLRLRLKKKCELPAGPHPACDEKCANGGVCDKGKRCRCPMGYMGQFCQIALCYPQCRNGGTCSSPGRCSCPSGYHGRICEGGICRDKCLNGGKCVQKDTCSCQKGYYGNRCEISKCVIPCVNGGKCKGVNKCRCKPGFSGHHCEIITTRGLSRLHSRCTTRCRHGTCVGHGTCECSDGFIGRWCRRRERWRKRKNKRKKLWV